MCAPRLKNEIAVSCLSSRPAFLAALIIAVLGVGVYWSANQPFSGQAPPGTISIGVAPDVSGLSIIRTTVRADVSGQRLLVFVRFSFQQIVEYGIQVIAPFELTDNYVSHSADFEGNPGTADGGQPCFSPSKQMSVANATFQPPPELSKTSGRYEVEIVLDLKVVKLESFEDPSSAKSIIILGFFGKTPLDAGLIKCALRLGSMRETGSSPFDFQVQLPEDMLLAQDTFPSPNEIFHTEKLKIVSWSFDSMTRPDGFAQTVQASYYSQGDRYCADLKRVLGLLVASVGFGSALDQGLDLLDRLRNLSDRLRRRILASMQESS